MPKNAESVATAIEIDHEQLKELVKIYYKAKKALFCWGATGIGKSQTIKQAAMELAKELGLEYSDDIKDINNPKKFIVIDIRLAQCDPSDLRGIPVFDKDAKATIWLPPEQFPRMGSGIIFYDELNLSAPLVQASAYEMILDRRLGTYKIPEGFSEVAAGNRLEDRANVFEMAAPLKNRFGHCQLQIPEVDAWTNWAFKHEVDPRIIGYLNFKRTALYQFDAKLKECAFCTPRSWEACSDLIKEVKSENLAMLQLLTATELGVGTAGELAQFIRVKDKLKPMDYYLKNPDSAELPDENTQPDLMWALITSLAEHYKFHNDSATLDKIIRLLKRMNEEFAIFTLKLMVAVDRQLTQKIVKIPQASALAKKLIDYFD